MASDPVDIKRLLSTRLLMLKDVAGVGVPEGRLTVYLKRDSSEVRQQVGDLIHREAPEAEISYVVSGSFTAR